MSYDEKQNVADRIITLYADIIAPYYLMFFVMCEYLGSCSLIQTSGVWQPVRLYSATGFMPLLEAVKSSEIRKWYFQPWKCYGILSSAPEKTKTTKDL